MAEVQLQIVEKREHLAQAETSLESAKREVASRLQEMAAQDGQAQIPAITEAHADLLGALLKMANHSEVQAVVAKAGGGHAAVEQSTAELLDFVRNAAARTSVAQPATCAAASALHSNTPEEVEFEDNDMELDDEQIESLAAMGFKDRLSETDGDGEKEQRRLRAKEFVKEKRKQFQRLSGIVAKKAKTNS